MATTRNWQSVEVGIVKRRTHETGSYPPAVLEYAWYANLAYAMVGPMVGIVIPLVGGMIWVLLAGTCLLSIGGQAVRLYKPVAWAFETGILVIAIQLLFHDWGPQASAETIEFAAWVGALITVQALSLRPGFLLRFGLVGSAIALAALPFIQVRSIGGVMRAFATGTQLATPNVLGMWFGFSTVYFVFLGFQAQKLIVRAASWIAAVGCFFIVLIAVSRAPLLAVIIACIVGFRSALKRSFVPLLAFVLLIYLVSMTGVFDEWLEYYFVRGTEESGRGRLWPAALERIPDSPWVGFGLGDVKVLTLSGRLVNPHNPCLHIALGAGIIPVICFLGYLVRVATGAFRSMQKVHVGELQLLPPLVVFAMLEIMNLDLAFMSPWVVVVFGLAAQASQADHH